MHSFTPPTQLEQTPITPEEKTLQAGRGHPNRSLSARSHQQRQHPRSLASFKPVSALSSSSGLERELDPHPGELIREVPKHVRHRNGHNIPTTSPAAINRARDAPNPPSPAPPRPPTAAAPAAGAPLSRGRRRRGGALPGRRDGTPAGGGGQEGPAGGADVRDVAVRAVHEPVVKEESRPVAQQGVAFHLPQSHPALVLAPLDGLPRQLVHGARCSHLRVGGGGGGGSGGCGGGCVGGYSSAER